MSSGPYLFVYGTLQSSFTKNRFSRYLAQNGDLIGRALIPGRLYALTRYPGLRPPQSDEDWAAGEVYRLRCPVQTLQTLDAYEASDYRRVRRLATLEDGRAVRCWVYMFWTPLPRHRRIASGTWRASEQVPEPHPRPSA
jgi:gamma-glutamylcyclotransferase (GGCT)/AIG2-like uncharacterized protein YtfP